MRNTVAVMNTNGVVGKSTIVVALAEAMAGGQKKNVLVIDSDAQARISSTLMTPAPLHQLQCEGLTIAGFLVSTVVHNAPALWPRFAVRGLSALDGSHTIYLIPSGTDLTLFERRVSRESLRAKLDEAMGRLLKQVRPVFDLVLIDCPAGRSLLAESWLREADFHISLSKADRLATGNYDVHRGVRVDNPENGFAKNLGIVINMKGLSAQRSRDADQLAPRLAAEVLARLSRVNSHSPATRAAPSNLEETGAGDEIRTHDPHVGNVMLYP
jgi:chromosome partitioning protein